MSPDVRIVAEPPLAILETLLQDNRHKLLPADGMNLQHCLRHGDCLCLLFGDGVSLRLIAADTRDGSRALLGALEILDTLEEDADVGVSLLSARPPPGRRWLQRHTSFTWVRARVLDIDGRPGLLLEFDDAPGTPMSALGAAQRPPPNSDDLDTVLADSLTDEETAFLQHL